MDKPYIPLAVMRLIGDDAYMLEYMRSLPTQEQIDQQIRWAWPDYDGALPSDTASEPTPWMKGVDKPVNGEYSLQACSSNGVPRPPYNAPRKKWIDGWDDTLSIRMRASNVPPPARHVPVSRAHEREYFWAEREAHRMERERNRARSLKPTPPFEDNQYRADYIRPDREDAME